MAYEINEDEHVVELAPRAGAATASVIWLHGLGADGHDFVPLVPELRLPSTLSVRFIFPHAPVQAVTINNGYRMRAWYDIMGLTVDSPEDSRGVSQSATLVGSYIDRERGRGVAVDRIVIAGFSQGGAIALYAGLRYPESLAGVLALSTYLPLRDRLATEASSANRHTSILMCHGTQDPVVGLQLSQRSRDALLKLNYAVRWIEYPMRHELCPQEIQDISQWLTRILG
jgi:phospholipase/carboxylesterase